MKPAEKLGTIVELPDGRRGTVVFRGLSGLGIKWGEHNLNPKDFEDTSGDCFSGEIPTGWRWSPDAMLREHSERLEKLLGLPCVGEEFTLIREGSGDE